MTINQDVSADAAPSGPHEVVETEHLWIEMPDGVKLAARLWMPDYAGNTPVPALLEYIPYRKADMVRARDERNHPYFASHGYACLRVDMRGSGDSQGVMTDMYTDIELSDARHVIEWIAAQPWCSGNVGMFGTSWGGTAALQANIDAPSALKAVIAVCATHDRYEDDIHHMGGCLLTDTFEWGATLPAILAAPPTPYIGPSWRAVWMDRLERLTFPLEAWLRKEARGVYWRHGSVKHRADQLSRPILAVGGWTDRYSNSVMALVSARPDLTWGIVGPWGHHYPDHGHPGPAIGFQNLALEWWDHWLKGVAQTPNWPRLRVWLREFDTPADAIDERQGRWIESDALTKRTRLRFLDLGSGELQSASGATSWAIPRDLNIGSVAGDTGYFGRYGGLPADQQVDDRQSLVFDTPPYEADLVLFGAPEISLVLQSVESGAQTIVRICDIAPDGTSCLISRTVRNLTLNDALDAPDPLSEAYRIVFPTTAYRIRAGHRLRVSLSASYWPMIWPMPGNVELNLISGRLQLPVFDGSPDTLRQPLSPPGDLPKEKSFEVLAAAQLQRWSDTQPDGGRAEGWHQPYSAIRFKDTNTVFGYETRATHMIDPQDPLSARTETCHRAVYDRPDGQAEIESNLTARADTDCYLVECDLTARWDGSEVRTRHWSVTVPRKLG